jgi:hypothetical protein
MRMVLLVMTALSICCAGPASAQDAQPAPAKEQSAPSPNTAGSAANPSPSITLPEAPPAARTDSEPPAPSSIEPKLPDRAPSPSPIQSPRYGFQRVDGGFLRFDYQSGKVAFCAPRGENWGCEAVPEERATLDKEVETLRGEVADLKQQVESLREPPPPRPPRPVPPSSTKPEGGDMTMLLPGREQVAQATAVLQNYWHQFVALILGFKNDLLRKS